MSWVRGGDTSADYPRVNAVAALPDAPDGAVLLMHGFMFCLATNSASWKSDYVVDVGTIMRHGGVHANWLIAAATKTGLLTKVRGKVHGVPAYRLVQDDDYLHIKLKAESDWEAQQRRDTDDLRYSVPVRLRDGDLCRYCGVITYWTGGNNKSDRRGTLDHRQPADAEGVHPPVISPDDLVVACLRCNSSIGDTAPDNRPALLPPPAEPFYGKTTAAWLTRHGHPTSPTDPQQRPAAPADTALRKARQRPASKADTARAAASDPAPAGHRAASDADQRPPPLALIEEITVEGADWQSFGSGRVGSGSTTAVPVGDPDAPAARRKRSRRGKPTTQRKDGD